MCNAAEEPSTETRVAKKLIYKEVAVEFNLINLI
jgi:hypothetical protein